MQSSVKYIKNQVCSLYTKVYSTNGKLGSVIERKKFGEGRGSKFHQSFTDTVDNEYLIQNNINGQIMFIREDDGLVNEIYFLKNGKKATW